jgi:hypothetical protein
MHDISIEPIVEDNLKKLEANGNRLTDVFMLTKKRLSTIGLCLRLHKNRLK